MISETFSTLWDELVPTLKEYRREAEEVRTTISESYVSGVESRVALDRLETIVADLGLIRSRCRIVVSENEDAYEDAWRSTMHKTRIGEYTSAKERDATYTTGAVEQLIALRRAKRMLADVDEVYEYCLIKYRGAKSF